MFGWWCLKFFFFLALLKYDNTSFTVLFGQMWVNVVFPIRPGRMQGEGGELKGRITLKIAANIKIIYLVC